jgi:hypothetical protein
MQEYYNGYLFNEEGAHRVYNPSMMVYFFEQILQFSKPPKNIIDLNLKTDYGRLRRLIQNDSNRETLIRIVKEDGITAEILEKFSIDMLNDNDYFISLLFYMGLLTIKESRRYQLKLIIPNYSIKTLYWEYIMKLTRETSPDMKIETGLLNEAIYDLATKGDPESFISYISQSAFAKLSDHDLKQFDEKYIQILLLSYLFMSKAYVPMSEYEAVPGRADIYLQRSPQFPEIKYEWLFELKYCKTGAKPAEIAAQQKAGEEQLNQYLASHRLGERSDLKAAVIVFTGKNKYKMKVLR